MLKLKSDNNLNNSEGFPLIERPHVDDMIDYPPLLTNEEILFDSVCESSFTDICDVIDCDEANYENLIRFEHHDSFFSMVDFKNQLPIYESDVSVLAMVNSAKNIVFFSRANDPTDWLGFVTYSQSINIVNSTMFMSLDLGVIYVKPKYRGNMYGRVMSHELGRSVYESLMLHLPDSIISVELHIESHSVHSEGKNVLLCLEAPFNIGYICCNDRDVPLHIDVIDEI